jgi:cyclophilin family peptidyl-prolyl cis-trans isomerase
MKPFFKELKIVTMTRVRRPKQQHQVTLLRLVIFLASIGVITLLLFRIDSDFTKKDRKRLGSRPVLLSPEQLISNVHPPEQEQLQQRQQQEQKQRGEIGEENRIPSSAELKAVKNESTNQREGSSKDSQADRGRKRYRIELANLVGGGTGTLVLETRPSWAPIGAKHFDELVADHFYDECRFFRVVPNFVVQFGINASPQIQALWRKTVLRDDPVLQSNSRGTITYATSGKNTRATQLFINKKDNKYLDKEGFAPFGVVVEGMEFVDQINDEYKEKPNQGKIQSHGNAYLEQEFPNLSYIASIREMLTDAGGGVAGVAGQETV